MKAQSLRSNMPITLPELKARIPALFAAEKHASRSDKYLFISTMEILQALQKEGFDVFAAFQSGARTEDVFNTTKHQISLRHRSQAPVQVGDVFQELNWTNSHGGQSKGILDIGVYRLVCSNGMKTSENFNSVHIRHSGNMLDNIIEGAYEVIKDFEKVSDQIEVMRSIELNSDERTAFANAALSLRYEPTEVQPRVSDVLRPRRSADAPNDLFTTFNRVQESLIRGGIPKLQNFDYKDHKAVVRKTRPINGIDENTKLNKALWSLTEQMLLLKGQQFREVAA